MITFLSNISRLATSTAFWVSFVLSVVSYLVLAPHSTTIKQRAWILTTLSSAVMSLFSLPLVAQFAVARGQLKYLTIPLAITDSAGRFFQAYLITDLIMGMLFYRSKVNFLTGWIHHSVYIFIVEYAIQGHWSHIFCLAAVMEIPTFVLALGSLMPRLRSDVFFAVCFFVTRIALHVALCVSLVAQRKDVTNGSFGPAIIMACIFPLHVHWFSGCLKGFLKRGNTVEKSVPVTKQPVNTISSPERLITPSISGPIPLYASRALLARRRTALRMAVRARWNQFKLWKAGGRLSEMQRRVRAALPGRDRVYEYVGLEDGGASTAPSVRGLEYVREDASLSSVSVS
ncbi:hypothetical protein JVT61DRAFT_15498 [Boletus reticuloceps]|uniref:TLC domain-containing protein n=1 Tax=Boletus reticuloceps TaxID=495285 RepID=A0A8I3A296_9AGAM|nr:hypothetical protein JVT61DRAFT_15498 [Boletus reticuloceps]